MNEAATASGLPPHAQVIQIATAYWGSQMVLAAAQLQLADRIGDGARTAADLASELGLQARPLHRFMRTLAGMGVLTEQEGHAFALTELGQAMRKDAPGSAYATILTLGGELCQRSWNEMRYSLETGKPGLDKAYGQALFDYLAERPEEASLFSETMVGFHGLEPPAVAAAFDFDRFGSIVDVGGATGNMLVHICKHHPRVKGLLYDLPHVVTDAPALLEAHGMADRISIEGGSFFEAVPAGHDAYILSHIIHDWDEDRCHTILGLCREAMNPGGRVLIVEMVLPEGDTPHAGKMLDMMMLVGPGGQERTPSEYAELLAPAGLKVERVVPTASDVSIVEASAV